MYVLCRDAVVYCAIKYAFKGRSNTCRCPLLQWEFVTIHKIDILGAGEFTAIPSSLGYFSFDPCVVPCFVGMWYWGCFLFVCWFGWRFLVVIFGAPVWRMELSPE